MNVLCLLPLNANPNSVHFLKPAAYADLESHSVIEMIIFSFICLTAVQHERGPRNSTIRRQVAMYLKETSELSASIAAHGAFRQGFFPAGMMPMSPEAVTTVEPPRTPPSGPVVVQPTPKVSSPKVSYLLYKT